MVRHKNRYFLFEIIQEGDLINYEDVPEGKIVEAIKSSAEENFGDLGISQLRWNIKMVYYNNTLRTGILRADRKYKEMFILCLMFVKEINSKDTKIRLLHCSGTIKKIEKKTKLLMSLWLNRMLKSESIQSELREELMKQHKSDLQTLEEITVFKK